MGVPGQTYYKDPDAEIFFGVNWTDFLGATATIATSSWDIVGPDSALTKDNESILAGNKIAILRLLGGTLGEVYTVRSFITTNETPDQIDVRSFMVRIAKT